MNMTKEMTFEMVKELTKLSKNLQETVHREMELLEQVMEYMKAEEPSTSTSTSTKYIQTSLEDHFDKVKTPNGQKVQSKMDDYLTPSMDTPYECPTQPPIRDDMSWCMVSHDEEDEPTPKLRRSTRKRKPPTRMDGILVGDEVEKSSQKVRTSTRNRKPPKRMNGILVGNEMEVQLNQLNIDEKNRVRYLLCEHTDLRKLLDQYLASLCSNTKISSSRLLLNKNQYDNVFHELSRYNSNWDCTETYDREYQTFRDEWFEYFADRDKRYEEPMISVLEFGLSLCYLFDSDDNNLDIIYNFIDFYHLIVNVRETLTQWETRTLLIVITKMRAYFNKEFMTNSLLCEQVDKDISKLYDMELRDICIDLELPKKVLTEFLKNTY